MYLATDVNSSPGPNIASDGVMAVLAVHEASHACVSYASGGKIGCIKVGLDFVRGDGATVRAFGNGAHRLHREGCPEDAPYAKLDPQIIVPKMGPPDCCFRFVLRKAIVTAAARALEQPEMWRAVRSVEAELFSGLIRAEPPYPMPRDSVEYLMTGARGEELIAAAGVERANILVPCQCSAACSKPRKPSRRGRAYVLEWEAECAQAAAE